MKRIILALTFLALSANAKWVMFSGQSIDGRQGVYIYNDETGEVFSKFTTGGFLREKFGDVITAMDADGREIAVIDKPREKPKK